MKKFILAILVVVFAAGTVNTPAHADNPALVPFLANWTPQPGGYTVVLVNYDSSYQWTFTPSTGQYYFDGQHQITVTGALGGFPSTLTVTTNKSGYATGTAKITGNVIGLPWNYTPSIQAGSQSATGFTAQITNYDSSKIWQWSATAGSVVISNTGLITVTNLSRGQQSIVTVNVSQIGYMTNTASYTGSSTAPPLNLIPAIGSVIINNQVASIPVTNFDNYFDWSVSATAGNASIDKNSGVISVSGLSNTQVSRVTVTDSHSGQIVGQATFLAYINPAALVLKAQFGSPTSSLNGAQVSITNYDSNFNWSVNSSVGQASIDNNGLVTVTGMSPGQTANLTVTATAPGAQSTSSSVSLSDWPQKGLDLVISGPTQTSTGFDFLVSDYNNFYTYSSTVDYGQVTLNNQGFGIVSGLTPGQQAQVTLTVSKDGQTLNSIQIHSAAILNVQITSTPPAQVATPAKKPTQPAMTGHNSTIIVHPQSAAPVTTLICLKGTQHKFVTGVKPVCPSGFVKQK